MLLNNLVVFFCVQKTVNETLLQANVKTQKCSPFAFIAFVIISNVSKITPFNIDIPLISFSFSFGIAFVLTFFYSSPRFVNHLFDRDTSSETFEKLVQCHTLNRQNSMRVMLYQFKGANLDSLTFYF